jgi:YHS domain-containing protein
MLLRLVLMLILGVFLARAFWKMVDALIEGLTGTPRGGSPAKQSGGQMVRDPVCGTFVLPGRALSVTDGRAYVFFCSTACRDKYRAAGRSA